MGNSKASVRPRKGSAGFWIDGAASFIIGVFAAAGVEFAASLNMVEFGFWSLAAIVMVGGPTFWLFHTARRKTGRDPVVVRQTSHALAGLMRLLRSETAKTLEHTVAVEGGATLIIGAATWAISAFSLFWFLHPVPEPCDRGRLCILVMGLQDDNFRARQTRHISDSLEAVFQKAGNADAVQIKLVPRTIRRSDWNDPGAERAKSNEVAQRRLMALKGDVVVYGSVVSEDKSLRLAIFAKERKNNDEGIRPLDDKTLTLPQDFGTDLGGALAAVAANAAAPASDTGHYMADVLKPSAKRLEPLVVAMPPSFSLRDQVQILTAYAAIELTIGEQSNDKSALRHAVDAYSKAEVLTRDLMKPEWAQIQKNLCSVQKVLGEREEDNRRFVEAVAACNAALTVRTRDRVPLEWAEAEHLLGNALMVWGEREKSTARLEEAVAAFRKALEVRTRQGDPIDRGITLGNIGASLTILAKLETGTSRLTEAINYFHAALKICTRARVPLYWARTQLNLGTALNKLGERESGPEGSKSLGAAVDAYREALQEYSPGRLPYYWGAIQNNIGSTLWQLADRENSTEKYAEAVIAFREALKGWTLQGAPRQWALAQFNLGMSLVAVGTRKDSTPELEEAIHAYREALKVFRVDNAAREHEKTLQKLRDAERLLMLKKTRSRK